MNLLQKLTPVASSAASMMVFFDATLIVRKGVDKDGKAYHSCSLLVPGGTIYCNIPEHIEATPSEGIRVGAAVLELSQNSKGIRGGRLLALYGADNKVGYCADGYKGINLPK